MANVTWNPSDKTANATLSGGNLTVNFTSGNHGVRATDKQSTGKYYFEVTATTWNLTQGIIGVANSAAILSSVASNSSNAIGLYQGGNVFLNNANTGVSLGGRANGNIIGIAIDLAGSLFWCRVAPSGNWNGNAGFSPGGTGGVNFSAIVSTGVFPFVAGVSAPTHTQTANFGDSSFSGAVPAGFTSGFPAGGAGGGGTANAVRVMVLA